MIYRSPYEKKHRRFVRLRTLAILIAGFIVASLLDFPLLHLFYFDHTRAITQHDWYRMLRVLGFLGTWGIIAIVFILHDRNRHRGAAIFLSTLAAGGIAELLKLVLARERPVDGNEIQAGFYHFRGLFSGFADSGNLGLPSSHAAVAFAGCLTLAAFLPNTKRFLFTLALGCALTRMLTGAHFASDVYLGAVIGWLVSLTFIKLTPASALL